MGNYVNPISDVREKGRAISGNSYDQLLAQCMAGEFLVGIYSVMQIRECAPVLDSADEYQHFEESYRAGMWLSRAFYAVNLSAQEEKETGFPNSYAAQ